MCLIDLKIASEIFTLYQLKEILFLSKRSMIFWLYNIFIKDLHKKKVNKKS